MSETANPKERRLVLRLLEYWRGLCGERDLPMSTDVDGEAIPDMWGFCFLIEVNSGPAPVFTYVGDWHKAFHGEDLTGRPVNALEKNTLIERATHYADEVVTRCIPVTYGGEFDDTSGRKILYRSILLPLSDDGDKATALLGGANCRVAESD